MLFLHKFSILSFLSTYFLSTKIREFIYVCRRVEKGDLVATKPISRNVYISGHFISTETAHEVINLLDTFPQYCIVH